MNFIDFLLSDPDGLQSGVSMSQRIGERRSLGYLYQRAQDRLVALLARLDENVNLKFGVYEDLVEGMLQDLKVEYHLKQDTLRKLHALMNRDFGWFRKIHRLSFE